MRLRTLALVCGLLAMSSPAFAQSHPCDQAPTPQATIQSGAPHKIQFCAPQSDAVEAIVANVDGKPFDLLPVTAKTPPSATGKVLYETTLFLQVAKGTHTLAVAAYNRNAFTGQLQLGAFTSPFPFAAADDTPPPSVPAILGVVR